MTKDTLRQYLAFRRTGVGDAAACLENAKTVVAFEQAENAGLVRLMAHEEMENYFDVFGTPDSAREGKEIERILDVYGCWVVESDVFNPETKRFEHADSIGMCTGYDNPLDPMENWYVPDLMRSALDRIAVCGEH